MVCLGLKPGAAGWQALTNPLSNGGTPANICLLTPALSQLSTLAFEALDGVANSYRHHDNAYGHHGNAYGQPASLQPMDFSTVTCRR